MLPVQKKGYSGVAIWSKIKPVSSQVGFIDDCDMIDDEGRILTIEFEDFNVINTYVPNAGQGLKRIEWKCDEWNKCLMQHIWHLESKKPVIWGGDLNVARSELDLARPKQNWNKTPGYTEREQLSFESIVKSEAGELVDAYRLKHATECGYTYYSYRFGCRGKNLGWRLDYFMVSDKLVHRIHDCTVRSEIYGASDHLPLVLFLKR